MVDEWLARIDRFEQLMLSGPGLNTVRVARFAGLYAAGGRDGRPTWVWWQDVSPAARTELAEKLQPFASWEPKWSPNPAGEGDPFLGPCEFSFDSGSNNYSGSWLLRRQPDGRYRMLENTRLDDPAGSIPMSETDQVLDEPAARAELLKQLGYSGSNDYPLPFISRLK